MSMDDDIARIRKMTDAGDALLAAFKAQNAAFRAAAGDAAKVKALADEGDAKAATWVAAVTENTDIPPLTPA